MSTWFIFEKDEVVGPLTSAELKSGLLEGTFTRQAMVWSSLLGEKWIKASLWETEAQNFKKREKPSTEQRLWHYAVNGQSFGPYPRKKFLEEVKKQPSKDKILVWTKGMVSWASIYEFSELLDEIGISRREHPRADISGTVVVRAANKVILGKLMMISQGGCGVSGVLDIRSGEKVTLDIKSPAFNDTIRADAEVRYVTETGYVGLKFSPLQIEALSEIIDFVKQTQTTKVA
jgi:hypothetical protein